MDMTCEGRHNEAIFPEERPHQMAQWPMGVPGLAPVGSWRIVAWQ